MTSPILSDYFNNIKPSPIRMAQFEIEKRTKKPKIIDVSVGNVSLKAHPALLDRVYNLSNPNSPISNGTIQYTKTKGLDECNKAFLNIIASSGFRTDNLYSSIIDGGSAAMQLVLLGVCGKPGQNDMPVLLIDPAYTNYQGMADRIGRRTISLPRILNENGNFNIPNIKDIESIIESEKPNSIVIIPYDNPTGQFYDRNAMIEISKLAVKYNIWVISDEAYRELFYTKDTASSIWSITDHDVKGIEGRRISIETASKVWNACGLRIGALVTDNKEFHTKSVAEYSKNLCSSIITQYIFGALADENHTSLHKWYSEQREYYKGMMTGFSGKLKEKLPGIIISNPESAIYSVIDVRNIAPKNFDSIEFSLFCARDGLVKIGNDDYTLIIAPMKGFYGPYSIKKLGYDPGLTQMRVAFVPNVEDMAKVPELFTQLFKGYCKL